MNIKKTTEVILDFAKFINCDPLPIITDIQIGCYLTSIISNVEISSLSDSETTSAPVYAVGDWDMKQEPVEKDQVNSPEHYTCYPVEVIDMMISVFGKERTASFCLLSAFKYRMRAGKKGYVDIDLKKEDWFLKKHKEIEKSLDEDVYADVFNK